MIYVDTSFIVPLFREEESTPAVVEFLSGKEAGSLYISKWTIVEFASLVSRDVRMNMLTSHQGGQVLAEFEATVDASLGVWVPGANDFDLAAEYVSLFPTRLRAPDALHLAIAKNNDAEFVATLDEGMLFAAGKMKIKARTL